MELVLARPLKGRRLERVKALLERCGLRWEEGAECTACLEEGDSLLATGSRRGNVLQCVASHPDRQGEGMVSQIITRLVADGYERGYAHLFLFTRPENRRMFRELGFYPVAETEEVLLLENRRDGVGRFVAELPRPAIPGPAGGIVANCNPFTNGHLHLVERAAAECGCLHLFVLSQEGAGFPAVRRMELVRRGVAHLPHVLVHPTGDYLVSAATFPTYFHKEEWKGVEVNCRLDLTIFVRRFAEPLGITRRYVGTEPNCPVTASYNRQMKELLPPMGVEVVEIPRLEAGGEAVSASRVRELLERGRLGEIRPLVPPSTYEYLERGRVDGSL